MFTNSKMEILLHNFHICIFTYSKCDGVKQVVLNILLYTQEYNVYNKRSILNNEDILCSHVLPLNLYTIIHSKEAHDNSKVAHGNAIDSYSQRRYFLFVKI